MFSSSGNSNNYTFLRKSIASISKDSERYQMIQETGTPASSTKSSESTTKRSGSESYKSESKKRGQQSRDVGKISAAEMVDKVNREAMFMYMAMR